MPSILLSDNGASSGSAGLKSTAGNDGVLILQTTTSGGTATNAVYINTSQNVLIGKTSDDNTTQGIKLANAGYASFTLPNDYPIIANRQSSDGDIIRLRRDGTDVGAVGGASGGIYFSSGATPTKAMTIDSSQNVLVGTTTASRRLTVSNGGSSSYISINGGTGTSGSPVYTGLEFRGYSNNRTAAINSYDQSGSTADSGGLLFYTNANMSADTLTERARIDASGSLMVGTTSQLYSTSAKVNISFDNNTIAGMTFKSQAVGSFASIYFINSGGTIQGSITSSGTGSTSYATSSDYRLKENIAPMTGALTVVAQLKPCTYTWKESGAEGQGFIAHELQSILPDAVVGEKDGTKIEQYEISSAVPATFDEEGNELTPAVEAVMGEREVPVYQGIDTSFLVATLTAAIQELNAKVDAQAAEIAALKG